MRNSARALPTGTVTFLFTDIEGSTRLAERLGPSWPAALAEHRVLLRAAIEAHGGVEFETEGDALFVVFARSSDAVAAALDGQRALGAHAWPPEGEIRVRMAVHTGEVGLLEGGYVGLTLHYVARLCSAGHGGQVLLSAATKDLIEQVLPADAVLGDLGEYRLKDLTGAQRIFQVSAPDLPKEFARLRALDWAPNNLPASLNSFIGRDETLAELAERLTTSRVVTLVGPGGAGKTRIALQAAATLVDRYRDGVWLVDLSAITDGALVEQAVAAVLGVREEGEVPLGAAIERHLRTRQIVLVIDNCEQVLAHAATLVERLVLACSQLRVIATSREPLRTAGEVTLGVPPLPFPPDGAPVPDIKDSDAVRLFEDRARAVVPGFVLDETNAGAVGSICRRLDGIPLAIELAAARARALTPQQIDERLGDRFRLLSGGARTAPGRQQTLRALVDWSHDLLTEPERVLFRRLAVFAGGFDLEHAEAVCAGEPIEPHDVIDLLARLVERSLVAADHGGGRIRYRLLETVREYARTKLAEAGEEEATTGRHARVVYAQMERLGPAVAGSAEPEVLDAIARDLDNLRAALSWACEHDPDLAGRIVGRIWRFFEHAGARGEGSGWAERALAAGPSDPRVRAEALAGAGHLALLVGNVDLAGERHGEGLILAHTLGDPLLVGLMLNGVGNVARHRGEFDAARTAFEEAVEVFRPMARPRSLGYALANLAVVAHDTSDLERARTLYEESLAAFREAGDRRALARGLSNFATLAIDAEDYATAHALLEEAIALAVALRSPGDEAYARNNFARVLEAAGDLAGCEMQYREVVRIGAMTEEPKAFFHGVWALAEMCAAAGDHVTAARLIGAGEASLGAVDLMAADEMAKVLARLPPVAESERASVEDARRDGAGLSPREAAAFVQTIPPIAPRLPERSPR